MNRIILSLLFFFVSLLSFSQGPTFSGSVIEEETNTKMVNAIVTIEGTGIASTTDENGEFSFIDKIPVGDHIVSVTKDGYESRLFPLTVQGSKKMTSGPITLSLTKQEKKRRKKVIKNAEKEAKKIAKEKEKMLKDAKKELEKREKALAKQKKKQKKNNKDVVINYDNVEPNESDNEVTETPVETYDSYSEIQVKYANILGVTPQEISNIPLYEFIEGWTGTPYLWGGTNHDGIDCSSFTQRLYQTVNDQYIERTAEAQYKSKLTGKCHSKSCKEKLHEGDLIFFGDRDTMKVTHVGVYLRNKKFINATEKKTDGVAGVKIDDLTEPYWVRKFIAGGRRINKN